MKQIFYIFIFLAYSCFSHADDPSENSLTALMADGSFYMSQNNLETAYKTFTQTINLDPNWAEAWNKRATVLYLMGNMSNHKLI